MKALRHLLLISVVILCGCSKSTEDAITELDDNRRLWGDANGSYNYSINYRLKDSDVERNVQIHVRRGKVVSILSQNADWLQDKSSNHSSIDNLMDRVQQAIEDDNTQVDVKYHKALGYPVSIRTWETGQVEFDTYLDIADLHFSKE